MELIVIAIAIQDKTTPNYVVPTSNFIDYNAEIIGVPCKVLSDQPYKKSRKTLLGDLKVEDVIDVQSCVTGFKYTIPFDWVRGYDSLVEANDNADILGHHFPNAKELIGKPYWPRDNSYITDAEGNWKDLFHKKCEIISIPYTEKVKGCNGTSYDVTFVIVRYEGKTYRVMFQEDGLVDPLDFFL
jgi:hypothetical protein